MTHKTYLTLIWILPTMISGMEADFIPSAYSCGASIKADGTVIPDTIERGIACLKSGHKQVYMPPLSFTGAQVPSDLLPLSIGFIIAPAPHKLRFDRETEKYVLEIDDLPRLCLYTSAGKNNAELLAYYFETLSLADKTSYRHNQETGETPKAAVLNHYLIGYLLGYDEQDIKAFYNRVDPALFEKDKQEAITYINNQENQKNAHVWLDGIQ